ncbi:MAG: hydrogenase maturation nickel metallochaperone HypA [Methanoregulaceae archaeon]|jgi:hydrogenase nickel incorporation protein HypA/HybF
MHEYSIAYDLYATARKAAMENHANSVNRVCVEFGKMAMVNPEQVVFLFNTIKENDPLFTKTTIDYQEVLPLARCSCGWKGEDVFVCPKCGALPELLKGREIVVTNIAIEVDD